MNKSITHSTPQFTLLEILFVIQLENCSRVKELKRTKTWEMKMRYSFVIKSITFPAMSLFIHISFFSVSTRNTNIYYFYILWFLLLMCHLRFSSFHALFNVFVSTWFYCCCFCTYNVYYTIHNIYSTKHMYLYLYFADYKRFKNKWTNSLNVYACEVHRLGI